MSALKWVVTWVVTWYAAVTSIANESAGFTCEIDHVTSFSTNQRAGMTVIDQPEACTADHVMRPLLGLHYY